jgi:hypothetical protein
MSEPTKPAADQQTQAPTNIQPAKPANPPESTNQAETPEQKREAMARKRISSLSNAFQLLETGLPLRTVAKQLGVPYATLRVWMMDEPEPAYKHAQKACILYKLAESDEAMEMADTAIAVTRARETLKHSQWLAERRLPHLFAPRQELTGAGGAPLAILDVGEASRRLAYIRAAESARDAEIVESPTTTYSVEQST